MNVNMAAPTLIDLVPFASHIYYCLVNCAAAGRA